MKKLILLLVVILIAGTTNAQEITELKEAKVGFTPLSSAMEQNGNSFSYNVRETYAKQFEKDPLAFMETYFDIQNFIAEVNGGEHDTYVVTFMSSKGKLKADFNSKGELVRSSSVFKNIILPADLREKLYRENKGWEMITNIHSIRGKNGIVTRDVYKIKLKQGNQSKKLVFDAPAKDLRMVSN